MAVVLSFILILVSLFIVFVKARKGYSSLCSYGNSKATLGVLYRPPHSCASLFDTLFSVICNCLNKHNLSDLILLGDFNIDFLNTHSTQFCKLSIISSLLLSQVVNEPTVTRSVNGSPGPCFCIKSFECYYLSDNSRPQTILVFF